MDAEDDDLSEMRSALLASLSSKPPEVEEDLSALRLAALMTRRQNQNQIQVIHQRPVPLPPRPPPPFVFPGNGHFHMMRQAPPPPLPINNLISLTPGPGLNIVPIALSSIQHLQQFGGRPIMRPFHGTARPHFGSIRPPVRPIRYNQIPSIRTIRPPKPTGSVPVEPISAPEVKVTDKFSRYNSDSSSDEDDMHTTDKKKTTSDNEESDVESVASEKSFSSVSDVVEADVDAAVEEIEKHQSSDDIDQNDSDKEEYSEQEELNTIPEKNISDDNISIIDDGEDDILAAIDDFLEDRPEKAKPKKNEIEVKKNVQKKTTIEKPKPTNASSTNILKKRRSRSSSSSVNDKTSIVDKRIAKKQAIFKVQKLTKKPTNDKTSPSTVVKTKTSKPTSATTTSKTKNSTSTNAIDPERIRPPELENTRLQQRDRARAPSRPSVDKRPTEDSNAYNVPVVLRHRVPSPSRQRRDSDLDSVGTSDLSFISSESEEEIIADKPIPVRRPRTRSGEIHKEEVPVRDSKRNTLQITKHKLDKPSSTRYKGSASYEDINPSPRTFSNPDLRKKLENRNPRKEKIHDPTISQQRPIAKPKSSKSMKILSPVSKTGVINLKKKTGRIPPQTRDKPKSRSSSIEDSPRISLPEIDEARRIIITRPNTSALSNRRSPVTIQSSSKKKNKQASIETKTLVQKLKTLPVTKPEKRTKTKDKSTADNLVLQNKMENVPPVKLTKRQKLIEDKTQYKKVIVKRAETPESSEESDSSSSEESAPDVYEEEVFAFNGADLPLFDDVLGKVDDDSESDVGEYISTDRKSSKNLQSKSKKRKRSEIVSRTKLVPDRRRIVPKTDSNPDDEEQRSRKPIKKSVHQRLGGIADREESNRRQQVRQPVVKKSHSREIKSPGSWSAISGSADSSASEYEESRNQTSVVSSAIRIPIKHRILNEDSESALQRGDLSGIEKPDTKRRKRKILVSGKSVRSSTSYIVQGKESKRDEDSRSIKKHSVKERLGKVVLSSVSMQPKTSETETRRVDSHYSTTRHTKDVSRISSKRRKQDPGNGYQPRVSKPVKKEDGLEARIKRIKQQNGLILRRQKEIEMEKERFGF